MDVSTLAEGWVGPGDGSQRHYYRIEEGSYSGSSLCGKGLGWSRNWVLRHGSENHGRADNCQNCNRIRLKLLEKNGQVN